MSDYEVNEGYIRVRYREIGGGAYAKYVSHAPALPMGHFELSVGTSATPLPSIPANARRVVIYSVSEPLTYTDDGSTPSATHGMLIPEGVVFVYDTDPSEDFLMWCPANSDVRIAYYG